MASLIDMYSSSEAPDISGSLRSLRQEERDRNAKNWQGSRDLLRSVATDTIRKDYKDGISWDDGVKSADDSFKRQYDRMMSVDPAAAAQLREDYLAERTKRVNSEIADKYQGATSKVNADIQAIEQEIMRLESEIQSEETEIEQAAQAEANSSREADKMVGYTSTSPDTVINVAPNDLKKATPELYAQQGRAEQQMSGYTPEPTGLRSFYGDFSNPAVSSLPSPRSGVQTPQDEADAYGMKGYRPLTAWYGGMK